MPLMSGERDTSLIAFGSGNWPEPPVEVGAFARLLIVPSSGRALSLIGCVCGNWAVPPAYPEWGRDRVRSTINCISLWELGSASGVVGKLMDAIGGTSLKLVINCICQWNFASASGRNSRLVGFFGKIWPGEGHVINCIGSKIQPAPPAEIGGFSRFLVIPSNNSRALSLIGCACGN